MESQNLSPCMRRKRTDIINLIKPILFALEERDIPACVVGEIALNYYNVPRVVHVSLHHVVIPESLFLPLTGY